MKRNTIIDTISFLLIILFVYTAVSKLSDLSNFQFVIKQTRQLRPYGSILSIVLPALEISAALLLVIPSFRLQGFYLSFILMFAFTFFTFYISYVSSEQMPCACGGIMKLLSWRQHVTVNSIFTILSILGIFLETKSKKENKTVYNVKLSQ